MQHITVPLPDGLAPSVVRRLAVEIDGQVNRRTGALVDATVTDLAPLTDQERRVLVKAIDIVISAVAGVYDELQGAAILVDLRARLDPDQSSAVVAASLAELSREQECAADAMAGEYGRSRVRHLADGAVVIVGLTDDVERRTVCVERDGRERWRS